MDLENDHQKFKRSWTHAQHGAMKPRLKIRLGKVNVRCHIYSVQFRHFWKTDKFGWYVTIKVAKKKKKTRKGYQAKYESTTS